MKFFFDNCLPRRLANAISALVRDDGDQVKHLRDLFQPSVADLDWISGLAKDGDWYIISGDSRILRNKHEREAWRQSGLTIFVLAKGWMQQDIWNQAWSLVRWWPRIMDQAALVQSGASFEVPFRFGSGKFKQPK